MDKELLENIYKSNKNLIIEGQIASGKTSNIGIPLIKNIIKHNESVLIVDSKEEYLTKYYNSFKDRGYNTIVINLRNMSNSDGYNFFSYPYKLFKENREHESIEFIERIYKQLLDAPAQGTDPFWNNSAINFLEGLTITLFEDGTPNQVNIHSIVNMIDIINKDTLKMNTPKENEITKYFKKKNPQDLSYVLTVPTLMATPETRSGIITTAYQGISRIATDTKLKRFISKTTFNYNDILSKPTAIFIVTQDEYTSLNFIASIFINQLYYMLISNNQTRKFNLILDNFDTLKNIENLKEILSSGISRKVKTTIITRSIKELEKKYGKYIYSLSDTINIDEYEIKANISGQNIRTNNINHKLKTPKPTYKINKIKNKEIKTFDIESKIKINEKDKIKDLIKKIDDKIKELEIEKLAKEKEQINHLAKINSKINELIEISEAEERIEAPKNKYNPFSEEEMRKLENKIAEKIKESENKEAKEEIKVDKKEPTYTKFNPFSEEEMKKIIEKRNANKKEQEISIPKESKEVEIYNSTDYKKYRQRKVNTKKIIDKKITPENNEIEKIKKEQEKRGFFAKLFR